MTLTDAHVTPGAYGLNRNVAVTVLVATDRVVSANFALVQPSLEVDAPKIFKSIADFSSKTIKMEINVVYVNQ